MRTHHLCLNCCSCCSVLLTSTTVMAGKARSLTTWSSCWLCVAGAGKSPVQAAVLHGLGVVAALIPPHMLARGRVGELVGEGAQWAGQLTGELREAGQNMRSMLSYKHQEGVRLMIERDLAQPREIKMRVEKKNIHIK